MSIQYCHNCGKNIDTDFKEPMPEIYISNTTGPICKLPHLNSHNLLERFNKWVNDRHSYKGNMVSNLIDEFLESESKDE